MTLEQIAKNLLADRSCDTCWACARVQDTDKICSRANEYRGGPLSAENTCENWNSRNAADRRKALERKLIMKWKALSEEDLERMGMK